MAATKARFEDDKRYLVEGKTLNEIFDAIKTATLLKGPGYDVGIDPGNGTTLKISVAAAGGASYAPWQITSLGEGGFSIAVGSILKGDDSVSASLTCTNPAATFTGAAGKILAAKITSVAPVDYTLVLLNSWPEAAGAAVTFTGSVVGGDFEFVERHYPLWAFAASSTDPSAVALGESLVGVRVVPPANLVIQDSLYRTPGGEVVMLPRFGISHLAIPA